MKIFYYAFLVIGLCVSCGGNVTTVGNPKGATISVAVTNDVDDPAEAIVKAATIAGGLYTPDRYILGIRNLALVRCTDASGADMECPGQKGREIDEELGAGETLTTVTLNSSVLSDHIIYTNTSATLADSVGNTDDLETSELTDVAQAGTYSGLQIGLDFIITSYPSAIATVDVPDATAGSTFVLYCINENGCSESLGDYAASYLDELSAVADINDTATHVQAGDLVFLNAVDLSWYWWDVDAQDFVLLSAGRPANPLGQGDLSDKEHGSSGEFAYNASFGATTPSGLDPFVITEAQITDGAADTLTLTWSVVDTASFEDKNSDNILDVVDLSDLSFGKPEIEEFAVTDATFTAENEDENDN